MSVELECEPDISSPQLAPIPKSSTHRLVDTGLLHLEATLAGFSERYRRGETTHTLHVWWARRPHTAMRILTFASLCPNSDPDLLELMADLVKPSTASIALYKAREILNEHYPSPPTLLDMFGGGGTIPFEAANLGAQAYSIDSNQLSVFIQKSNLVYSQNLDSQKASELIKSSGTKILTALKDKTNPLFPLRDSGSEGNQNLFNGNISAPIGYFWTYSIVCPSCKYRFFLSKRPWLSKKKGRRIAFTFTDNDKKQQISISEVTDSYKHEPHWEGRNGRAICPKCSNIIEQVSVRDTKDELVAIVKNKETKGKEFFLSSKAQKSIPSKKTLKEIEDSLLAKLDCSLPNDPLPQWSGIVNPAIYGVKTYADFLNPRQRIIILMLIDCLLEEYNRLLKTESIETANYVISALSSLLDQLIDWNCRLSMWISQNEQVGRAFCGPGISMLWDYVEIDPLQEGPANLWDKLKRILSGIETIGKFPCVPIVKHGYAQVLPFESDFFDAIVTDPPYYDNIFYTVLADFFFSWKRILLKHIDATLFSKPTTDSEHELVASKHRSESPSKAHEKYCSQLAQAINEAARVLKPEGVFTFVYSHSSLQGWEAFLKAFRNSNFIVTSVQPLSIERKHRPRGVFSEAVNTCIAFIAHKISSAKPSTSINPIVQNVSDLCNGFAHTLKQAGWKDSDVALAVFAHGVGELCNYQAVTDVDSDQASLQAVEAIVKKYFQQFKIKSRKSL